MQKKHTLRGDLAPYGRQNCIRVKHPLCRARWQITDSRSLPPLRRLLASLCDLAKTFRASSNFYRTWVQYPTKPSNRSPCGIQATHRHASTPEIQTGNFVDVYHHGTAGIRTGRSPLVHMLCVKVWDTMLTSLIGRSTCKVVSSACRMSSVKRCVYTAVAVIVPRYRSSSWPMSVGIVWHHNAQMATPANTMVAYKHIFGSCCKPRSKAKPDFSAPSVSAWVRWSLAFRWFPADIDNSYTHGNMLHNLHFDKNGFQLLPNLCENRMERAIATGTDSLFFCQMIFDRLHGQKLDLRFALTLLFFTGR